jgi:hypothetical protein
VASSGRGYAGRSVTFTADDEATTTLRLHVVADFSDTVRAGAEKGWASQLDKLAQLLAAASWCVAGATVPAQTDPDAGSTRR